jgi:xanthine dehydrogenase accessory factor
VTEAFIGAGGKTTTLFCQAKKYRAQKKSVFVTTTTHMMQESDTFLFDENESWQVQLGQMLLLLKEKGYLMAGCKAKQGKISALPKEVRDACMQEADVSLIEADGSKRLPLKYPDKTKEPVLDFKPDTIWILAGCIGLNQPMSQSVFRYELACKALGWQKEQIVSKEMIGELLYKGYVKDVQNQFGQSQIIVALTNGNEEIKAFLEKKLSGIKVVML